MVIVGDTDFAFIANRDILIICVSADQRRSPWRGYFRHGHERSGFRCKPINRYGIYDGGGGGPAGPLLSGINRHWLRKNHIQTRLTG